MSASGWIGVDLDGTLAEYGGWQGPDHIGKPIRAMVMRVKGWLEKGVEVRIFTARVSATDQYVTAGEHSQKDDRDFASHQAELIKAWCKIHIGQELKVTAQKDFAMIELWDDRAVRVEMNTGKLLSVI